MSDYIWCHGPECHKKKTTDRVRGVKGSKVLRTKRIKDNHITINIIPLINISVVNIVIMISLKNTLNRL